MWSKTVGLLLIMIFVQFGVLYWVYQENENSRTNLIDSQRRGCERSKMDRSDNAKFQRAHTRYINKVTGAQSVKEDVKKAARQARSVFLSTSQKLTLRSRIDCKEAFP